MTAALLTRKHTLRAAFAIVLCLSSTSYSAAQLPNSEAAPQSKAGTTARVDPLGRETPRGAMMGLLKYEASGDFSTAAQYLQPPSGQKMDLVQAAQQSQALRQVFKGDIALLSDEPAGTVEAGLPLGQERAGVFVVGSTTVDIILVRVDDPQFGKIWLVSRETVARVPGLYAQLERQEPTAFDRIVPTALASSRLLGMSAAQWIGWLLSIPVSWFLAWLLAFLLSVPRRVWYKLQKLPVRTVWQTRLGMPLKCIMAILLHGFFVYLLNPPLFYRVYYFHFLGALLVAGFAWLVSRIMDRGFDRAVNRTRAQRGGGESILVLMQRLTRIVMFIIALVSALALFGVNVKTTLAGLGIGGLAIALGAQKTLENILGGVTLLMDKAVHVGDFCAIGGKLGTVEDIGLRSIKLRTLDQNMLVVPNMALAQMQFENMKARPKLLLSQTFSLRIETRVEQLRLVIGRLQAMLNEHPSIESGTSRIRVSNFAGASFELELWAYAKTGDWGEFTAIRQDIILKIAEVIEGGGVQFAGPTRITYLSREAESTKDTEKAKGAGVA
jgi:MscS family membrane protein